MLRHRHLILVTCTLAACAGPGVPGARGPVSATYGSGACPPDLEQRAALAFSSLAAQAEDAGFKRVGVTSFLREDSAGSLRLVWEDGCRERLLILVAKALAEAGVLPDGEWPEVRQLTGVAAPALASRTDDVILANAFQHDALYDASRLPEILSLSAPPAGLDGVILGRYEEGGELLLFAVLADARGRFIAPAESAGVEVDPDEVLVLVLIVDSSGSMEDNDPHAYRTEGARVIARTVAMARQPVVLLGFVGFDSRLRWTFPPSRLWLPGVGESRGEAASRAQKSAQAIIAAIDQIDNGAQTNMQAPLEWALQELRGLTEVDGKTVGRRDIFLLTDGVHNEPDDSWKPSHIAKDLVEAGIHVWAVGLGPGAQKNELSKLASATGGRFFDIEDENAMAAFLSTFLSTYQPKWSLATEDEQR